MDDDPDVRGKVDAEAEDEPVEDELIEDLVEEENPVEAPVTIEPVKEESIGEPVEESADDPNKLSVEEPIEESVTELIERPVEPIIELDMDVENGGVAAPLVILVVIRDVAEVPAVKLVEINVGEKGFVLKFPELAAGEAVEDTEVLVLPVLKLVIVKDVTVVPMVKLIALNVVETTLVLTLTEVETAEAENDKELMLPVLRSVASEVVIAVLGLDTETVDEAREFPLGEVALGDGGEPVTVLLPLNGPFEVGDVREEPTPLVVSVGLPVFVLSESIVNGLELGVDKVGDDTVSPDTTFVAVVESDNIPLLVIVDPPGAILELDDPLN